jgi:hypothetical protein
MVSEAVAMFVATGAKSQFTCFDGNEVEGSYTEVEGGGHENKAKLEEHKDGSCVRVSKSAVQCFPLAASVETPAVMSGCVPRLSLRHWLLDSRRRVATASRVLCLT